MKKSIPYIIVATLIGAGVLAQNLFSTPPQQTQTATALQTVQVATDTPTVLPAYAGCAYMWAYHDAPELTQKIDDVVRAINPAASANVNLFGEDCVYADGRSTFGAMETDFYVRLPVDDLTNEDFLGDWMAQVLPLIVQIPREEIQGKYGFAEFWFEKKDAGHVIARVPIQKYNDEAQGKTGAELFRMFYIAP